MHHSASMSLWLVVRWHQAIIWSNNYWNLSERIKDNHSWLRDKTHICTPHTVVFLCGWNFANCVLTSSYAVYPKQYAHGFVVLCFVVVVQSFIMNSHEVFIHIHQGCFAGTGAIVRLPQCQWSKPDGYGKISQCITTTKHSKAKTVCIFLGIYCKTMSQIGSKFSEAVCKVISVWQIYEHERG